jgi:hypothetical protein
MSRKKIIWISLIALVSILIVCAYLYIFNKPSEAQKYMLGITINIPDKDGLEANMTNKEKNYLKGFIKNLQTGKKSNAEVIAYVNKMTNLSNDASFIIPFELNYGKNEKYLYLGIFYFEFNNTSIINKADSPKTIKHAYSYLLGKNINFEKIDSVIPGPYSCLVKLGYLNDKGNQEKQVLRFYYEKGTFEIAKKCEEVGTVVTKEKSNGEKYDVCVFNDSHECALGAYEKGNCPVNGYDVSKTDNPIEKWGIAEGFLFKNGAFIFPANYMQCTIDDFYFSRCKID